jgi:hypothetical protein
MNNPNILLSQTSPQHLGSAAHLPRLRSPHHLQPQAAAVESTQPARRAQVESKTLHEVGRPTALKTPRGVYGARSRSLEGTPLDAMRT